MSAAIGSLCFVVEDEKKEGDAGDEEERESDAEKVEEEDFEVPAGVESRHKYLRKYKCRTIDFPAARRDPAIITDYEEGNQELSGGLVGILLEW